MVKVNTNINLVNNFRKYRYQQNFAVRLVFNGNIQIRLDAAFINFMCIHE